MKTLSFLFAILVLPSNIFSQSMDKVKISGGFIIPSVSIKGVTANLEYQRQLSSALNIYVYTGIYSWDKNQVTFQDNGKLFNSYSEDSHLLYPLYLGTRFTISTIKTFTVYANFELGYNYLTYNSYRNVFVRDANNKFVVDFYADGSTRQKVSKSIFGFGVGLEVTQKISNYISLLLEAKRNMLIESWDNTRTHYYFNAGILISI